MMTLLSASYANEDNTAAIVITAENGAVVFSTDKPDMWARLMASGLTIAPFVPPPEPPRQKLGTDLFSVLTKTEHQALSSMARADDLRIITSRGQDEIPITNSKLARLAAVVGITVDAWFARLP